MRLALSALFKQHRSQLLQFAEGFLVGPDSQTTGIFLRLDPEDQASVPRDQTIAQIRELASRHKLPQGGTTPAYVVGEPVLVHDMFEYVEQDGQNLFYASLALLAVVIFLLFFSVRWVLLSVLLVGITVLWTKAILVICGMRLSVVSSMLNSLVTIVGVATVMRLMVYYREQRRDFRSDRIVQENGRRAVPRHFVDDGHGRRRLRLAPLQQDHAGPQFRNDDDARNHAGPPLRVHALAGGNPLRPGRGRRSPAPSERRLVRFLGAMTVWVQRRWRLGDRHRRPAFGLVDRRPWASAIGYRFQP